LVGEFAHAPLRDLNEFIGTRAVNRRLRFRIRTLICLFATVCPLFLGLGISIIRPGFTHGGSQVPHAIVPSVEMWPTDTPDGTTIFAVWAIWLFTAVFVLAQGYMAMIAKMFSGRRPVLVLIGTFLPFAFCVSTAVYGLNWELNHRYGHPLLFLKAFRIFCAHPAIFFAALVPSAVAAQCFCEKIYSEQEVL
jgi:hypothetical protein